MIMATSSSVKRPNSLLRYFSKTGEQPSSPKRRRDADDSEESESETESETDTPLPNTEASSCSASAIDASSSSEISSSSGSTSNRKDLNVSGSWGGSTGLIHSKVVCIVGFVKNIINDHFIVIFGIQCPARDSITKHYCP